MYGWFPPRKPEAGRSSTFGRGGHDPGGRLVSLLVVATVMMLLGWAASLAGQAGPPRTGPPPSPPPSGPVDDLEVVRSREPLVGDEMAPAIVLRPSAGGPFPALIGVHGQGGGKERWVEMFRPLASQGILVILIDIRAHGERRVPGLDPRGAIAASDYFRLCLGTVEDLRSLLDRVAARADVRPGPVGIWGYSMGAYIALAAAAHDARLDPICVIGAWHPEMPLDAADYPDSRPDPVELAEITERLDPVARVGALPDRRVLLLHGDEDGDAPLELVRRFLDALTAGYPDGPDAPMLLVYRGGHHPPSNVMSLTRTWLARAMCGSRGGS